MESSIVIKVKYGETLRRFNARVLEKDLDLDMVRLREKILGLFNFASDAELMLTYIDEDGDVVTLADEDDLCDVVRQSLNPLRISVRLSPERTERSYARSSGNSTPMWSPRSQPPLQNFNTGVSEILKSVPDPLREVFSKMSAELASKAASSGPGLAELVDNFSKVGLTYLGKNSNVQAGQEISALGAASESTLVASDMKGQPVPKVAAAPPEKLPGTKPETSTVEGNQNLVEPSSKSKEVGLKKVNQEVDSPVVPPPGFLDSQVKFQPVLLSTGKRIMEVREGEKRCKPIGGGGPTVAKKDAVKSKQVNGNGTGFCGSYTDYFNRFLQDSPTMGMDSGSLARANEGGSSSAWHYGPNSFNECPFSGMTLDNVYSVPPMGPYTHHVAPSKRSYNHGDIGSIFHRGICCDGCGVHPITGPRYKSKVKYDYDLCSICFARMGSEVDYIRLDFPVPRLPFKGMHDLSRIRPPAVPHGGSRVKSTKLKLDSRFIQDVNVLDGTIMAPLTPFTKIWRMRNNGNTVWPRGSQLVWVGGDRLSDASALEIEIPVEGLPVDKELDIAVDFAAPGIPGRYVSYWRMSSPSGQKFGQRIWVLIQVDASMKDTLQFMSGLNLNLPAVSSDLAAPEFDNMNVEPLVEGSFPEPYSSNRATTELVEPTADAHANKNPELSFPMNDDFISLVVDGGASNNPVPSSVPYHVDFTPVSLPVELPPTDVKPSTVDGANVNTYREETLLRELEEMGFKQVDRNKEILRMNEYDLEQSVDALCGVSEWDPILEELKEMGFHDDETNMRLLKKNNGSIKRVVIDLITGEKA